MFCVMLIATLACNSQTPAENAQAAAPEAKPVAVADKFGESITPKGALAYADLQREMAGKDSLWVKVSGTVAEVCQVKGCWMNLTAGSEESAPLFVQFKDYGFFMPKDIAGREVIMEGYAYRDVTSVEDQRHFAEDAGKTAEEIEAITEPKEELKFLASGVLLLEEE